MLHKLTTDTAMLWVGGAVCRPPVRELGPLEEVLDVGLVLEAAQVLEPLRVHEVVQRRQRHNVKPAATWGLSAA
jgi:hypothetical protein